MILLFLRSTYLIYLLIYLMTWLIHLRRNLFFSPRDKIKYVLFSWETDLRASCVPARRRRASPRSIPRLSGADLGSLTPETASEPSKCIDDRCAAAAASRAPGKPVSGAGFAAYRRVYLPDVLLVGYLRRGRSSRVDSRYHSRAFSISTRR